MKLYKDLGDVARKLLTDDFVTENKFKFTSKTSDGATYTVSSTSSSKAESEVITGEMVMKCKNKGLTLVGKLPTSGTTTAEAKYEKKTAGKSYVVSFTGGESKALLKSEIISGKLGFSLDADLFKKQIVSSSTIAIAPSKYSGFVVVGGKGLYSITDAAFSNSQVSASYFDGVGSEITVAVNGKGESGSLWYSHKVSSNLAVAAQITHQKESKSTKMNIASALKLDPVTTIKSRIDTAGLASLSYIQDIRPQTQLVLSTTFDVTKMDTAKVGACLTFE